MQRGVIALWLSLVIVCHCREMAAQTKLPVEPSEMSDVKATIDPPFTVKGGHPVPPPRPVSTPDPQIPKDSVKGTVLIKCVVGTDGQVHDPSIMKSLSPQNDASALEAVKSWRFFPTKRDGKVVAVRTTLAVVF